MAQQAPMELQWPLGGISKKVQVQSQPPYTTPDAQNVRHTDVIEGRTRGGSRAGLGKMWEESAGTKVIDDVTKVVVEVDAQGSSAIEKIQINVDKHHFSGGEVIEIRGQTIVTPQGDPSPLNGEWTVEFVDADNFLLAESTDKALPNILVNGLITTRVNLLAQVDFVTNKRVEERTKKIITDKFQADDLGDNWKTVSKGGSIDFSFPTVLRGMAAAEYDDEVACAYKEVDHDNQFDFETEGKHEIGIHIIPYRGSHRGTYKLYICMEDGDPSASAADGVTVTLTLGVTAGSFSGTVNVPSSLSISSVSIPAVNFQTVSGTILNEAGNGVDKAGWFRLILKRGFFGFDQLSGWWQGTKLFQIFAQNGFGNPDITLPADGNELIVVPLLPGGAENSEFPEDRVGFGMVPRAENDITLVDTWQYIYEKGVIPTRRSLVVASACGKMSFNKDLWKLEDLQNLDGTKSKTGLAADRNIQSVQYEQDLLIADFSEARAAGKGQNRVDGIDEPGHIETVKLVSNTLLKDINVKFEELGIVSTDDLVYVRRELYASITSVDAGGGEIVGEPAGFPLQVFEAVYIPGSQSGATLGLTWFGGSKPDHMDGTSGNSALAKWEVVTYEVHRCPKIYQPTHPVNPLNHFVRWEARKRGGQDQGTFGFPPLGCPIICKWSNRICMAGNPSFQWFMSRQGDPTDWDYGAALQGDSAAATYGDNADAGTLGEEIRALVPFGDDHLIFGLKTETWVMRGDPGFGGRLLNISRSVGFLDRDAYCHGPNGELVFMSLNGLYGMSGQGSLPEPISLGTLPEDLLNIERSNYQVTMEYSVKERGIHIFLTPRVRNIRRHFYFDWDTKTFLPDKYRLDQEATAIFRYNSQLDDAEYVLIGGRDGYIRRYDERFELDDGEEIDNYIIIGPLAVGGDHFTEGFVHEIEGVLAQHSGPLSYNILSGATAEEAVKSTTREAAGHWFAGDNPIDYPRTAGRYICIKIGNHSVGRAWALEAIRTVMERGARFRRD